MAANSHNSNAYTDQEKKFLLGPLLVGTIAVAVFLYVYYTIPSRPYELHEVVHADAHKAAHADTHKSGVGEGHAKTPDHPQAPQGSAAHEPAKH